MRKNVFVSAGRTAAAGFGGWLAIALAFSCIAGCISRQSEEEPADCRRELTCWLDKHWTYTADKCDPLVVVSAPGLYRWDVGIRVPMFDKVTWHDEAAGVVRYEGQVIRFRTESGA